MSELTRDKQRHSKRESEKALPMANAHAMIHSSILGLFGILGTHAYCVVLKPLGPQLNQSCPCEIQLPYLRQPMGWPYLCIFKNSHVILRHSKVANHWKKLDGLPKIKWGKETIGLSSRIRDQLKM